MTVATSAVSTTGKLAGRLFPRLIALTLALALFSPKAIAQNPATSVSVDANANRRAIDPNIYGVSYGDTYDIGTLNAPLNRSGGNSTSMYDWQVNAHNTGNDWYFETYACSTPAGAPTTTGTVTGRRSP